MAQPDRSKDAYERMFLEILLRHQLPEEANVRIVVRPTAIRPWWAFWRPKVARSGEIAFALKRDRIDVDDSHLGVLGLDRMMPPPNW
jgi:hypothetical protein